MSDIASLSIKVDATGAPKAAEELNKVAAAAAAAGKGADKLQSEIDQLTGKLFPAAKQTKELARLEELLTQKFAQGGTTAKQYAASLEAIRAKQAALNRSLDGGNVAVAKATSGFSRLGAVLGGLVGIYAVQRAFTAIAHSTIEAEQAQAQLAAVLKSTEGAAGLSAKQLNGMAEALQAVTTYDDEAILGAESLLLTFTKIGGTIMPRATEAVLDLATALKTDLKGAAIQLGKALNDPVKGVAALGRAGVQFSEEQKTMIEKLVETNRLAEAQTIILKEVETQVGGSARAMRNTLGGALDAAKVAFGNLLEGDSGGDGIRGATDALNDFTDALNSAEAKNNAAALINSLFEIAAALGSLTSAFVKSGQQIGNTMGFIAVAGKAMRDMQFSALTQDAKGAEKAFNELKRAYVDFDEATKDTRGDNDKRPVTAKAEAVAATGNRRGSRALPSTVTKGGLISADVLDLTDKLREQAEAYGLTQSAALELQRTKELAGKTDEREIILINEAYDALIKKVQAGEAESKSAKSASKAAKDHAKDERDLAAEKAKVAAAQDNFTRSAQDMAAELAGPVSVAILAYERQLKSLRDTAATGAIGADALKNAEADLATLRDQNVASINREADQLGQLMKEKEFEASLFGKTAAERQMEIELRGLNRAAIDGEKEALLAKNQAAIDNAEALNALDDFRASAEDALAGFIDGSLSAKDAFKQFIDDIFKQAARVASSKIIANLFGEPGQAGGGSSGDAIFGWMAKLFANAKGNAFAGGNVIPFARGGVFNQPMVFPMAGGRTGLMGEAGPEAIMPLKRGADGQLGVQASGSTTSNVFDIKINVAGGSNPRETAQQTARELRRILGTSGRSS